MQEEQQEKEKPKISVKDFVLLLVVAIFFDIVLGIIQLIPVAGSVAAMVFNVVPFLGFYIWYRLLGIDFTNPKKSFTFFGSSFIEFIPGLNALPAWTLSIIIMYVMQKKDVILAKAAGVVGGAAGATAALSVAAKATGTKEIGKKLNETSEKLKEKSTEYKSRITPIQQNQTRPVGAEITPTQQTEEDKPNNMIPFPTKEKAPFSNSKQEPEHAEEWTFPQKVA